MSERTLISSRQTKWRKWLTNLQVETRLKKACSYLMNSLRCLAPLFLVGTLLKAWPIKGTFPNQQNIFTDNWFLCFCIYSFDYQTFFISNLIHKLQVNLYIFNYCYITLFFGVTLCLELHIVSVVHVLTFVVIFCSFA